MSARLSVVLFAFFFLALPSVFAQPSISSFSPAYGAYNDPNYIDIFGSGFYPGPLVVKFNGVQATTAAAVSATHIQARVPAAAPYGSGRIFVQVGGSSTLSGQDFTVIGPGPYASSFSPTSGGAGTVVIISGAHFTGATSVRFNGKTASFFVSADTSIQATAPSGVTSGSIVIQGPSGVYDTATNTTTTNFYVTPVITGFSPAAGRPGTNVVITGTNFLGTSSVQFGSVSASPITVLSNGAIRVSVPAGAQTGLLLVTAPAGAAQTTSNFVVQPNVTGFSPGFGPAGTSVTITGNNFLGNPSVKFNGVAANPPTGVTASQLTATVPAGATTGPITVTTTNGNSTSIASFYLPASITSFTPSNGPPGTLVKVTGVNFTGATAFAFNGTPASNFYISNNTTVAAMVPPGVSTGPLSITTPAGTANSTGLFYAAPSIFNFNPTHGLPGTNVVLTGANFLGATFVRFNGLNASFATPTNNTTLVATVPVGATTGPITVATPGGTNTTATSFVLEYTSDLSLSGTNTPNPVIVTTNLVYTITLLNSGAFPAPNVQFTNFLSPSVVLKSWSSTQGTLSTNAGLIIGNLGTLAVNAPVIITFNVVPQSTGTITNIATVSSDYTDPAPGNNTLVTTATVLPLPVLSIARFGSNQVKVAWDVALTNFALQSKTNISAATTWANVTNTPVISGNQRVMTESNNTPARFYRLRF